MANFSPDKFEITGATNELQCVLTTDSAHGYELGWYVMVFIPEDYGMVIEYVEAKIVAIPSTTQIQVDVDTRELATFAAPGGRWVQVAQVCPVSGLFQDVET